MHDIKYANANAAVKILTLDDNVFLCILLLPNLYT